MLPWALTRMLSLLYQCLCRSSSRPPPRDIVRPPHWAAFPVIAWGRGWQVPRACLAEFVGVRLSVACGERAVGATTHADCAWAHGCSTLTMVPTRLRSAPLLCHMGVASARRWRRKVDARAPLACCSRAARTTRHRNGSARTAECAQSTDAAWRGPMPDPHPRSCSAAELEQRLRAPPDTRSRCSWVPGRRSASPRGARSGSFAMRRRCSVRNQCWAGAPMFSDLMRGNCPVLPCWRCQCTARAARCARSAAEWEHRRGRRWRSLVEVGRLVLNRDAGKGARRRLSTPLLPPASVHASDLQKWRREHSVVSASASGFVCRLRSLCREDRRIQGASLGGVASSGGELRRGTPEG